VRETAIRTDNRSELDNCWISIVAVAPRWLRWLTRDEILIFLIPNSTLRYTKLRDVPRGGRRYPKKEKELDSGYPILSSPTPLSCMASSPGMIDTLTSFCHTGSLFPRGTVKRHARVRECTLPYMRRVYC